MSEYLIKRGLNITIADNEGNTPLHYAATAGRMKENDLMKRIN